MLADFQRLLKVPEEQKNMTRGEVNLFNLMPLAVPCNPDESKWSGSDVSQSGTLIAHTNNYCDVLHHT